MVAEGGLGRSASMERLRARVERIAPHFRAALLVTGPGMSGEPVARALYRLSAAAATGQFVSLSRRKDLEAALAEARGGLLYVARGEDLEETAQRRLLQALDEGGKAAERRLIVIAMERLEAGALLPELSERIGAVTIEAPGLRERKEDLPEIVAAMLAEAGSGAAEGTAMALLAEQDWSGGEAELRRVLVRAAADGEVVTRERVAEALRAEAAAGRTEEAPLETLQAVIDRHVAGMLARCGGNKARAAEVLGISRSTLYRVLEGMTGKGE